jgi:hypothetical protein
VPAVAAPAHPKGPSRERWFRPDTPGLGFGGMGTVSDGIGALNEEMTEHLGHAKNRAGVGRESVSVRNGSRSKTVVSDAAGEVRIEVPGTVKARSPRRLGANRITDKVVEATTEWSRLWRNARQGFVPFPGYGVEIRKVLCDERDRVAERPLPTGTDGPYAPEGTSRPNRRRWSAYTCHPQPAPTGTGRTPRRPPSSNESTDHPHRAGWLPRDRSHRQGGHARARSRRPPPSGWNGAVASTTSRPGPKRLVVPVGNLVEAGHRCQPPPAFPGDGTRTGAGLHIAKVTALGILLPSENSVTDPAGQCQMRTFSQPGLPTGSTSPAGGTADA